LFLGSLLVDNILLGLAKTGLEKLLNDVMDATKPITQDVINELTHRVAHEPVEMRDAGKKLAGEWVILSAPSREELLSLLQYP
jgi:hypothetical protein